MQKIIDPHIHFFDLAKGKYDWLKLENPPFWHDKHIINRNIGPKQLSLNSNFEFCGGVHIEAGFDNELPHNELCWLEQDIFPITPKFIFKSIAYADIKKPNLVFNKQIRKLSEFTTFVGIRYIIDENEPLLTEVPNVLQNLKCLEKAGILLEVQAGITNDSQTCLLLSLFSEVPQLNVVINHAGLPPLSPNSSLSATTTSKNKGNVEAIIEVSRWKSNLARLAQLPNCFIKCSGFEMQNRNYTPKDVFEVISFVHKLFGNNRLMLASNFPLTLFSTSYSAYWQVLYDCAKEANLDCERVMYSNARKLYYLKNSSL